MDVDPDEFKARLLTRRAELKKLEEDTSDSRRPVELDQSRVGRLSRMDALQGQAMAQETARRRRAELARIDEALRLIDDDEYGYCQHCGEDIPRARLEVDPATLICVDCVRKAGG